MKKFRSILKILFSILLVGFIAKEIDVKGFWQALLHLHGGFYVLAILIQILSSLIAAYKWEQVMINSGYTHPFAYYAKVYLIGTVFNQVLPTSVGGDAVRIAYVQKEGAGLKRAFFGVMVDRYYGIAGLLLINLFLLPFLHGILPHQIFAIVTLIVGIVLLALLLALGIQHVHFLKRWKIASIIPQLSHEITHNAKTANSVIRLLFLAIISNFLSIFAIYLIAKSLSLPVGLLPLLGIFPAVTLITLLPISFAGWGLREGAMITLLSFLGLPKTDIFSLSILSGILLILASLPGLYFYWRKNL